MRLVKKCDAPLEDTWPECIWEIVEIRLPFHDDVVWLEGMLILKQMHDGLYDTFWSIPYENFPCPFEVEDCVEVWKDDL